MQRPDTTATGLSIYGNGVSEDKARTRSRVRNNEYCDNILAFLARVNPARPAL